MIERLRMPLASLLACALIVAVQASEVDYLDAVAPPEFAEHDFHAAFERLKRLEGTWDEAEYGRVINYRLTGRGSALIEEFIGDPPMTSVYHLDHNELRMTHYCNAGNQPRMVGALYKDDTLEFDFVDVTNLSAPTAYHTRTLDIQFIDDDHVVLEFTGLKEGEAVKTTHTLTRRTGS